GVEAARKRVYDPAIHPLRLKYFFFDGCHRTRACPSSAYEVPQVGYTRLAGLSPGMTSRRQRQQYYSGRSSRRMLVTSLPLARMRAIACAIGSNATAMWKALA